MKQIDVEVKIKRRHREKENRGSEKARKKNIKEKTQTCRVASKDVY